MRTIAAAVLCFLFFLACAVVARAPHAYAEQNRNIISAFPGMAHIAGTDDLGRDRAARISLALVLSFTGACCASAVSTAGSLFVGALSAVAPSWLRASLLYIGDLSLTLPWLFLLMLVRAALPLNLPVLYSELLTFGLLALLGAPVFLRVNYEKIRGLSQAGWLLQAQAAGLTKQQTVIHLWPHVKPMFWAQFLLFLPACVIAEANLGTLGLGLNDPLPSLGTFLASLQQDMLLRPSGLTPLPVLVMVSSLVALELTVFGDKG